MYRRQHVGEAEAVKNKVQSVEVGGEDEERKEHYVDDLILQTDLFRPQIDHRKKQGQDSYVQVGQTLHGGGIVEGKHISDDRQEGVVEFKIGKGARCGTVGIGQGEHGVQQQDRRQPARQKGASAELQQSGQEGLSENLTDGGNGKECDHAEIADEYADIVVCKDCNRKGDHVEAEFTLGDQGIESEEDQGEKGYRVHPDDVPVIAHDKAAEGKHPAEGGDGKIVFSENLFQHDGEKQPCTADLDGQKEGKGVAEHACGEEQGENVQGRGDVIGDEGNIVGSHAAVPAPQKGFPVQNPILEFLKEGIILLPQVGIEHLHIAEGVHLAERKTDPHGDHGDGEGENQPDGILLLLAEGARGLDGHDSSSVISSKVLP